MLPFLESFRDLLLALLGFGLIILIHELGHFLAARWAGIRVEEFAIGFGPAVCSYRKGIGLRRGSTRAELLSRAQAHTARVDAGLSITETEPRTLVLPPGVSPTEYRLNWLPFGGYVKMLGQDDLRPDKRSAASDAYNSKPVWKRMIVVSAGVVMNLLLAAVLFVVVFMVGLPTEPAAVGEVEPGSPAARAAPVDPQHAALHAPGLQPGDEVLAANGKSLRKFNDLALAVAMSGRGEAILLDVRRPGADAPIRFRVEPVTNDRTRLRDIGVMPMSAATLAGKGFSPRELQRAGEVLQQSTGLPPALLGSTLAAVDGQPARSAHDLDAAARASEGRTLRLTFQAPGGAVAEHDLQPTPVFQRSAAPLPGGGEWPLARLLGLLAPLAVDAVDDAGERNGLRPGDVFARINALEWPDPATGVAEIRRNAGNDIDVVLLRGGALTTLRVAVSPQGVLGFRPRLEPGPTPPVLAGALADRHPDLPADADAAPPGLLPGSVVRAVNGVPIRDFASLRQALRDATDAAHREGRDAAVDLTVALPIAAADPPLETLRWTIPAEDLRALHGLGWASPLGTEFFEFRREPLRAAGPAEALVMGVRETHRVMMMTYLTIQRLFEGTVRVEHLRGPVGIAHLGSVVAGQGWLQLLFFLGLISVNLAVVNFLPMPIVDGGLFIMLAVEAVTGRPVSPRVQSVATVIGLLLIGAMFLVVTFHDVTRLLGF